VFPDFLFIVIEGKGIRERCRRMKKVLNSLNSSLNNTRVLNSRTTVWAVPVAHTGEMTNAYTFLDIAYLEGFFVVANCM
jgi:hypothetical protein